MPAISPTSWVAAAFVLVVGLSLSLFDPRNGSQLIEGFLKKKKTGKTKCEDQSRRKDL
jgi:hypothetical protein